MDAAGRCVAGRWVTRRCPYMVSEVLCEGLMWRVGEEDGGKD